MDGSAFAPDSLEANRRGQLSAAQERSLHRIGQSGGLLYRILGNIPKDARAGTVLSFQGAAVSKAQNPDDTAPGVRVADYWVTVGNRQSHRKN